MKKTPVSIIICTRNRAEELEKTLQSLKGVEVPAELACELLVVDNGSTDATRSVAESVELPQITVRYVFEPNGGQATARNSGLSAAQGEVILFTDDDVRFPPDWVRAMCEPILSGRFDAVAGGIVLAPQLHRPWMEWLHRACLCSTEWLEPDNPKLMVGANLGFSRRVLDKVPVFDTELGPGALGFKDDSLFSFQVKEAGFRMGTVLDVAIEHHPLVDRLTRESFLKRMRADGESQAYVTHHWMHETVAAPRIQLIKAKLQLAWRRLGKKPTIEGMPVWEMTLVSRIHMLQRFLVEQKKPRAYENAACKSYALSPPGVIS